MLAKLLSLFGCAHPRVTFPQGPRESPHVTCLDCGKEFAYDWPSMRVVGPSPVPKECPR